MKRIAVMLVLAMFMVVASATYAAPAAAHDACDGVNGGAGGNGEECRGPVTEQDIDFGWFRVTTSTDITYANPNVPSVPVNDPDDVGDAHPESEGWSTPLVLINGDEMLVIVCRDITEDLFECVAYLFKLQGNQWVLVATCRNFGTRTTENPGPTPPNDDPKDYLLAVGWWFQ